MIGVDGWGAPRTPPVGWYDPAIPAAAAAALPGRELLQAIIEGRLPPPPIASLVGGELVSVGDGQALFRITPDESTYNPIGMVHGGLLCTMLDSAAGCAVQTLLPAGVGFSYRDQGQLPQGAARGRRPTESSNVCGGPRASSGIRHIGATSRGNIRLAAAVCTSS